VAGSESTILSSGAVADVVMGNLQIGGQLGCGAVM
jgi:hypothetical protein